MVPSCFGDRVEHVPEADKDHTNSFTTSHLFFIYLFHILKQFLKVFSIYKCTQTFTKLQKHI